MAKNYIGFVNFNEFELSETNFKRVVKKYKLNDGGYTIKDSVKAGLWILRELARKKVRLKIHLCTASLKNDFQFRNRLFLHNILPFGYRTKEGTVKYLVSYKKPIDVSQKHFVYASHHPPPTTRKDSQNAFARKYFHDKSKKRFILSEPLAKSLLGKQKIFLVEEFPTHDRIEVETEEINKNEYY